MALKKKLVCNNIECDYWRIVGFNISLTGKIAQIFLLGYKDDETRELKQNLISKNYCIKQEIFDKYIFTNEDNVTVSKLYEFLKNETEDFKGAEDI